MTGPEPAPAPSSTPTASPAGIASGCALAVFLHVLASIAIVIAGSIVGNDGPTVVFAFWLFLGLLQWIYIYPAIRISRWRGWPGVVMGLWIAGGAAVAFDLAKFAFILVPVAIEKITGNSSPRTEIAGLDSRVVSTDATHIVIREGLGTAARPAASSTETYVVDSETKIDFRGPAWQEQSRQADMSWLTPGRQVNISYVFRNHERIALFVAIWVETRETPPAPLAK